jgi:hypothetical protein
MIGVLLTNRFPERARDLEYQSISGGSQYGLDRMDRMQRMDRPQAIEDTRTEIIIENSHPHNSERAPRRRYYY